MNVETYGEGARTFLAIHGWGGSQADFVPITKRLPDGIQLLSVDLPGYGASAKPARWELDDSIDELCQAVEQREIQDLTLVGFCSGAVLALFMAQRLPDRVTRIVMIDPFAFVPWYFRIFLAGTFGRRAYDLTFAQPTGRRITTWILRKRQSTDDDFMGAFGRVDHDVTLRWLEMLNRVGPVTRFRDIEVPIDIVHGERTFTAVRASIQEYRALWPQARVIELHNVGHLPLVRGARQLAGILAVP